MGWRDAQDSLGTLQGGGVLRTVWGQCRVEGCSGQFGDTGRVEECSGWFGDTAGWRDAQDSLGTVQDGGMLRTVWGHW